MKLRDGTLTPPNDDVEPTLPVVPDFSLWQDSDDEPEPVNKADAAPVTAPVNTIGPFSILPIARTLTKGKNIPYNNVVLLKRC